MAEKEEKPSISVEYEIIVRDKDGRIKEQRKEKSQSLLKNFMMLLNAGFKVGTSSVVDTGGTTRSAGARWHFWAYSGSGSGSGYGGWSPTAGEGDTSYGIVVGTSDVAVTVNDYKLGAQVPHGDADNKLHYRPTSMYDPVVDGSVVKQSFNRNFSSLGTVNIVVKEIGLIVNIIRDDYKIMLARDITTVTVSPGDSLVVKYHIKTG
jgi:hypothetical protein